MLITLAVGYGPPFGDDRVIRVGAYHGELDDKRRPQIESAAKKLHPHITYVSFIEVECADPIDPPDLVSV